MLKRCFVALAVLYPPSAMAQLPDFCPGQQKIWTETGGYECVPSAAQPRTFEPPPRSDYFQDNPVMRAMERFGAGIAAAGHSIYGSSSLGDQLQSSTNPWHDVKPPPGYLDPYLGSTRREPTPTKPATVPTNPFGTPYVLKPENRSNAKAAAPPPGTYSACVGASTFADKDAAYCESSGYTYLKNGTVLKNYR